MQANAQAGAPSLTLHSSSAVGPWFLISSSISDPFAAGAEAIAMYAGLLSPTFTCKQIMGTTTTQGLTTSLLWTANLGHLLCTLLCAALAHTAAWAFFTAKRASRHSRLLSHVQPPATT